MRRRTTWWFCVRRRWPPNQSGACREWIRRESRPSENPRKLDSYSGTYSARRSLKTAPQNTFHPVWKLINIWPVNRTLLVDYKGHKLIFNLAYFLNDSSIFLLNICTKISNQELRSRYILYLTIHHFLRDGHTHTHTHEIYFGVLQQQA